jgi:hypothetical protein
LGPLDSKARTAEGREEIRGNREHGHFAAKTFQEKKSSCNEGKPDLHYFHGSVTSALNRNFAVTEQKSSK